MEERQCARGKAVEAKAHRHCPQGSYGPLVASYAKIPDPEGREPIAASRPASWAWRQKSICCHVSHWYAALPTIRV